MSDCARLDRSAGRSLRDGFLRSATQRPADPALVVGNRVLDFATLEETARRWAGALLAGLEARPRRVGVFAHRSPVAYAGTLAALLAGAAYVPLNRTFPTGRTRAMLRLAELDALIVDRASAAQLGEVLRGLEGTLPILFPDEDDSLAAASTTFGASDLAKRAPLDRLPETIASDIAYLLFTSGSTGVPKGVPVSHGNVGHFIDVMVERYAIGPEDRFSQTFDQTFDLSVFDLFVAWERGASVHAMQPLDLLAPARFARKQELSVWFSVPSVPALMRRKNLLKPEIFPTLRWSLFCGEPLPLSTAIAWQQAAPNSVLENLYGPTELTIACLVYRWDRERSAAECVNEVVPIGRPYPGLGAVLVDEALRPVSAEQAGELCVTGAQTVPGYWRDPERTAERFVELEAFPGQRFYRTGDRVRRLPGGDYAYLGRTDHQIKVLGHRVELGEIEAALCGNACVLQAVALGWPLAGGTAQGITAFVSGTDVDAEALRAASRQALPDYMVPDRVIVVDEMPLNANGKIDRKQLAERLALDAAG